jgi:UrcA family protein
MRAAAAFLALLTATPILTAASLPALAEEPGQMIVNYSGLNSGDTAGPAPFETRTSGVARRICRNLSAAGSTNNRQTRHCRRAAATEACGRIAATASSSEVRRAR